MDFDQFAGKKVTVVAIPDMRVEGKVCGFDMMDDAPWMIIEIESSDKIMDGKKALVDCAMITCIVEME